MEWNSSPKNLVPASSKPRPQSSKSSNPSFSGNYQSKCQNSQFFGRDQIFSFLPGVPSDLRPTSKTPQTMARIEVGPRNFKHYVWLKDSFSLHALSKISADCPRQQAFRKGITLSTAFYRGSVLQSSVSCPQKRGQYATSYKPQCFKPIPRKSPFPNGTLLKPG